MGGEGERWEGGGGEVLEINEGGERGRGRIRGR